MTQAYDIGVLKFRPEVSLERQREALDRLGAAMRRLPGFVSREVYHDPVGQRWVDVVGWRTHAEAQASGDIIKDPEIAAIFASFDEAGTVLGIYEKLA